MSTKTPMIDRIGVDSAVVDAEIAAAMAGDAAARWRALEACRDYLQLVARRDQWSNLAGPSATSDLIQETIVGAWRNFSQFQGRTPAQLRAWMRAILVHASLNARRRAPVAHIESGGGAADLPGTGTSPSQAADKTAAQAALDASLAALPQRDRMAIHLRLWDRRPFAEIGAELGISEDAARMLFGRALAKLRESMRPGHDPG
jgi:RNA polymerase sigma-70 factor, ECF subfamily